MLIAIWPGFRDLSLGVAFDVGSTTIAGHLCDLATGSVLASAGRMNPQIGFGEDLMSRVSYVMMNEDGASRLTGVVRQALDELVGELVAEAGVERGDVLELTLVGNPIMHHLVLGLDPRELGTAPFALVTTSALTTPAVELGLEVHRGARVYTLPCIAGHVGADAAGAVLSEGPHRGDSLQLLVDVGTNAELVLGNRDRLLAASSPTGPAFEGAQISSGQRAAPGAIERVRVDRVEPRAAVRSDRPGTMVRRARFRLRLGDRDLWVGDHRGDRGIVPGWGDRKRWGDPRAIQPHRPRVVPSERTFSYVLCFEPRIEVTQNDVRAVQLAKAALHAGARLLMDHYGVDRVDEIRLAGAFGSHIDPKHAMVLGMIPDCDLDKVSAAGNAAGWER